MLTQRLQVPWRRLAQEGPRRLQRIIGKQEFLDTQESFMLGALIHREGAGIVDLDPQG
jgi:hypothetical protein